MPQLTGGGEHSQARVIETLLHIMLTFMGVGRGGSRGFAQTSLLGDQFFFACKA